MIKFLKKVGLTLIYPVAKIVVIDPLGQLSGHPTTILEDLKGIWITPKEDEKCIGK